MKLNGLDFKDGFLLAPLAGYSDVGFRTVCGEAGADVTFTEMLSAQAMRYNSKKTEDMAIRYPSERLVFAQIFGNDPLIMADAVKNPILDKFEGIDINMGCPAHKVIKNGEGSALLKDLPLASKVISSCVKAAGQRPVSVKVRLGFDNNNIHEIVRMCEESGTSFITVHGRTTADGFSGKPDYEAIASAKAIASIPVFGNGDVVDKLSYQKMIETGVDGVMIGRGAVGSPWVFSELKNLPAQPKFEMLKRHVDILRQYYPESYLTLYLRKHFLAYAASFKGGAEAKKALALQTNIDESLKVLERLSNHFEN